jgi:hypothetical protein
MENLGIKNKIRIRIKEIEKKGFRFAPGRSFFIEIGIGQKRWGQLMRNEKPITTDELSKISTYFNIPVYQLIEKTKDVNSIYSTNIY